MKRWWLEITLKSDLCTASGGGIAGLIDSEVTQENGLPIIYGRRIKGNLLEIGKELQENGLFIEKETLDFLFGKIGSENPGALRVRDGHLYFIPGMNLGSQKKEGYYIEDYDVLQMQLQQMIEKNPEKNKVRILELFTTMRTRTALDEDTGIAKEGSLQTIRVIQSGMKFRCLLELEENSIFLDENYIEHKIEKTLEYCTKGFRHMGLGNTRGFGEVTCQLIKICEEKKIIPKTNDFMTELKKFNENDRVSLKLDINLMQPLLLSGKKGLYEDCEDVIPGRVIQGAMTKLYIDKKLKRGSLPHLDKDFYDIFIKEGVIFGFGFFKKGDKCYYPCPSSIVKEKNEDVFLNRIYEKEDSKKKKRKSIHKMVAFDDKEQKIFLMSPEKEVRMHHSRPIDRGIGHAVRDDNDINQEDMGQFFQYVSLNKGQTFCCEWQGRKENIERLLDCLQSADFRLELGRSRSAEYGETLVRPISLEKIESPTNYIEKKQQNDSKEKIWSIALLSPMIISNCSNGRVEADSKHFVKLLNKQAKKRYGGEISGEMIQLCEEKQFLKFTHIGGYNSTWNLPDIQKPALDAGTIILVTVNHADAFKNYKWFESTYWGEMIGMGYGKVRITPYTKEREAFKDLSLGKDDLLQNQLEKEDEEDIIVETISKALDQKLDEQKEMISALREKGTNIHGTLVEQLISIFYDIKKEMSESEGGSNGDNYKNPIYKKMLQQIKGMNDSKREEASKFLAPCKARSIAFMETYLRKGKWSARNEENQSKDE